MQRKTTKQKKNAGTLQKCRVKNPPAYEKLSEIPDPWFELEENGLNYFNRFCKMLIDNKLMTAAYVPIITRAARYYEIYKDADNEARIKGFVQTSDKGWEQKGAWFTIMTDAEDRVTKIEEKFGMTLMTLQKIDIPKSNEEPDDVTKL